MARFDVPSRVGRVGAAPLFDGVVRRYRTGPGAVVTALNGLSLQVAAGSRVAVVGPSGSGKSTLLHLAGALDRPDEGTVRVDGRCLASLSRAQAAQYRRDTVGFIFQRYNLLPALTVLDNVLAPVLPYRVGFDKVARGRELLAAVGLSDRERALPARLSGGQQQRVAIARALIQYPRLLLADEPTGNLDSVTGAEILELLTGLQAQLGMTILVATHDSAVAGRCERVVRIADGQVVNDEAGSALEDSALAGPDRLGET